MLDWIIVEIDDRRPKMPLGANRPIRPGAPHFATARAILAVPAIGSPAVEELELSE